MEACSLFAPVVCESRDWTNCATPGWPRSNPISHQRPSETFEAEDQIPILPPFARTVFQQVARPVTGPLFRSTPAAVTCHLSPAAEGGFFVNHRWPRSDPENRLEDGLFVALGPPHTPQILTRLFPEVTRYLPSEVNCNPFS